MRCCGHGSRRLLQSACALALITNCYSNLLEGSVVPETTCFNKVAGFKPSMALRSMTFTANPAECVKRCRDDPLCSTGSWSALDSSCRLSAKNGTESLTLQDPSSVGFATKNDCIDNVLEEKQGAASDAAIEDSFSVVPLEDQEFSDWTPTENLIVLADPGRSTPADYEGMTGFIPILLPAIDIDDPEVVLAALLIPGTAKALVTPFTVDAKNKLAPTYAPAAGANVVLKDKLAEFSSITLSFRPRQLLNAKPALTAEHVVARRRLLQSCSGYNVLRNTVDRDPVGDIALQCGLSQAECEDACTNNASCISASYQMSNSRCCQMSSRRSTDLEALDVVFSRDWVILDRCALGVVPGAPYASQAEENLSCIAVSANKQAIVSATPNLLHFIQLELNTEARTQVVAFSGVGITKFRCSPIGAAIGATSDIKVGPSKIPCSSAVQGTGFSRVFPFTFQPSRADIQPVSIEFLSANDVVLSKMIIVGTGGNLFGDGDHFAHPIIDVPPLVIASPGKTYAKVLLSASGSHTHGDTGRAINFYKFTHLNDGKSTSITEFSCQHEIGVHGYRLDVRDTGQTFASAAMTFEVASLDRLPGSLLQLFSQVGASFEPSGVPRWAKFQAIPFSASESDVQSSTSAIIKMTGTYVLSGSSNRLSWTGCESDFSVRITVSGSSIDPNFPEIPSGQNDLVFSCKRILNTAVTLNVNGFPIPFAVVNAELAPPTLNTLVSARVTAPGGNGYVTGFYLQNVKVFVRSNFVNLECLVENQGSDAVEFFYPDNLPQGEYTIQVQNPTGAVSNQLDVTISSTQSVPVDPVFKQNIFSDDSQSAAMAYCHGRLYIASTAKSWIYSYDVDENYTVNKATRRLVASIPTFEFQTGTSAASTVLGMTCDPYETDSDNWKLYISRNSLFRQTMDATTVNSEEVNGVEMPTPSMTTYRINEPATHDSKISYLYPKESTCGDIPEIVRPSSNADYFQKERIFQDKDLNGCKLANIFDLITELPASNFDHAVNCIKFTHDRKLLACIGSSTNGGVITHSLRYLPETVLSAMIVEFDIFNPGFGASRKIQREWLSNTPASIRFNSSNSVNDQRWGNYVDITADTKKYCRPFVTGTRNPFGLEVTTDGRIHCTVSGPNNGFGLKLNGVTEDGKEIGDESRYARVDPIMLNVPYPKGCHMGHANAAVCNAERSRGKSQEQIPDCFFRIHSDASYPTACAAQGSDRPVFEWKSAAGNIVEYRSNVYGGSLDKSLYFPKYRTHMIRCKPGARSFQDCEHDEFPATPDGVTRNKFYPRSAGLALVQVPGSAHFISTHVTSTIFLNYPDHTPGPGSPPELWDCTPDRAIQQSRNGQSFILSGRRLQDLSSVRVFFGDFEVTNGLAISQSGRRITGKIPTASSAGLVNIKVTSSNALDLVLYEMFYYLPL